MRLLGALVLVLAGCDESSSVEKWELVMGQSGFAISTLHFDEHNVMHAVSGNGTTLRRRVEWNAWVPLPVITRVTGVPGTTIPRAWDVNGNTWFGSGVIYRMAKGESDWTLVPGSVGKRLVTVDPAGNVFATGPKGNEVMLAGTTTWVPSLPVTRVDANGRAYSVNHRLDGTTEVVDEALLNQPSTLFDAKGDVLEFTNDGTTMKVTRRPFASTQTTVLASFPMKPKLELLGCGLEGTCVYYLQPAVFRTRSGGALEQVGDTSTTSTGEELNFSGFGLWVGADGRLYLTEVSGQTVASSRIARLRPGGTWSTGVTP